MLDELTYAQDPYPIYKRLRDSAPVHFEDGAWWITRYAHVAELLAREELSNATMGSTLDRLNPVVRKLALVTLRPLIAMLDNQLFLMDPPRHTEIRKQVATVFSPREVEKLEPFTLELARQHARQLESDFMREFSIPFPLAVICKILGLSSWGVSSPAARAAGLENGQMRAWSNALTDVITRPNPELSVVARGLRAAFKIRAFLRDVPTTTGVIESLRESELSDDEVIDLSVMFVIAGHETTTNLLGNLLLAVRDVPGEWDRLREDPVRRGAAIEEILRFHPSVQVSERRVKVPFTFEGARFEPGQSVLLFLASANRDERVFDAPDVFDPGRERESKHLGLGRGMHFCLGAALTRMEMRAAVDALTERFVRYTVDETPVYRPSLAHHGLERLRGSFVRTRDST